MATYQISLHTLRLLAMQAEDAEPSVMFGALDQLQGSSCMRRPAKAQEGSPKPKPPQADEYHKPTTSTNNR